jgi:hypothetical protein
LNVRVTTPRIQLEGATDELLAELQHVVRDGKATAEPARYRCRDAPGDPAPGFRRVRRDDVELHGVEDCRATLGVTTLHKNGDVL